MLSPRLLLITDVKILRYYLSFTQIRDLILGTSSSSENNKNVDVGDQTRMQITLPINYFKTEGKNDHFS